MSRNDLSGAIPDFLGDFPSLRLLDLGGNKFSGIIPANLFRNCFRMRFVSFSGNKLEGEIPREIGNCLVLNGFDFSRNGLSGEFVKEICNSNFVSFLDLSGNLLSGSVNDKVSKCRSLEVFDISGNLFNGDVPFGLFGLSNISYFNVSNNRFDGIIHIDERCSESLEYVDISKNSLSGQIDPNIFGCQNLKVLDIGSNKISGEIVNDFSSLGSLTALRLGNNLRITGEIPTTLGQCRLLTELDLSGNMLDGGIPDNIFINLTFLKHLDLHQNQLNGTIPSSIGMLTSIDFLDLSNNLLTGEIPDSLGNLTLLTHFNLSYNNLTGTIPALPILQSFGSSAFLNNPFLCGAPLTNNCQRSSGNASKKRRMISVTVIVSTIAVVLIFAGACICCIMSILAYRKKEPGEEADTLVSESQLSDSNGTSVIVGKLVLFSKSLPSKYEDWEAGTKALLDKDCLVGGGSIGTVYKATLQDGIFIAVKKLETLGRIRNQEEFEQEMNRLGSLKHPNLVVFQGYYWSPSTQLMLSEFIPNNSLYYHLHRQRSSSSRRSSSARGELSWSRRFNIAIGTARALAYLHHDCKPSVLHLNIKSTNILLDEAFEAKLSDYGLRKLLPILGSQTLTKFHSAIGYVAPELASQSLRYSDKCDVYSFGVILLEIVTGRKPVDSPGGTEVVILRDHVRRVLEDGTVSGCFDRSLRGFMEVELIQVLKLGLVCTSDVASRRPNMGEVVQFLESIRNNS